MQTNNLTVSVLFGTGTVCPEIQELLKTIPQLKLLEQTCDPHNFINAHQRVSPDLVLVEMNGEVSVPDWLETLTQSLPHTPVLVCSHSREPDFLIRAMQVGIREFLPLPLAKTDLEAAVARVCVAKKRVPPEDSQQGYVIVVTGHKGGVGTTTLAVNLAVALEELTTDRLALVDLGRPFPDVGNFLDQEATYSISDLVHNLANLDQSFMQRIMQPYGARMSILHGCADFKDQEYLEIEALERTFSMLRSLYKYIVVDLGHWLDDLFVKVITEADLVLMLTGLTIPDLRNLKRFWPSLLELHQGQGKIKLVVNRHDKGNGLQLRDLEQITQAPVFDTLPSDYFTLLEALNQGAPLGVSAPRSKLWQKIKQLAERVKRQREIMRGGTEELVAEKAPKRRFLVF